MAPKLGSFEERLVDALEKEATNMATDFIADVAEGFRRARRQPFAGPRPVTGRAQARQAAPTPAPTTEESPYDVLGIAPGASEKEDLNAYYQKAKEVHPDMPGGDADAFIRLHDAFKTLARGA